MVFLFLLKEEGSVHQIFPWSTSGFKSIVCPQCLGIPSIFTFAEDPVCYFLEGFQLVGTVGSSDQGARQLSFLCLRQWLGTLEMI